MLTGPDAIAQIPGGKVLPIYLEGRLIPVTSQVGRELGLSINEVVRSVVEMRGDSLAIMINGRAFDLPSQLRFRPGDAIWARFILLPNGFFAFKLLEGGPHATRTSATQVGGRGQVSSPSAAAASNASGAGAMAPVAGLTPSPVVTSLFAQPANLSGLLQMLSPSGLSALTSQLSASGSLGPLGLFLQARPSMGRLSPDVIAAALRASGLVSEAKLLKGQPVGSDLKFALRDLFGRLSSANISNASRGRSTLESALREIDSSQADALLAQQNRDLAFSFVIPFKDADPVLVSMSRSRSKREVAESAFTINVYTNSQTLGEIWMKATISEGKDVDFAMWAVRDDISRRAVRAKPELVEEMESVGLQMKNFLVFTGRKPEEPATTLGEHPGGVVDQKA
ncbi:MAG: hypothetical protein VW440_04990 [Bordetella sp.]